MSERVTRAIAAYREIEPHAVINRAAMFSAVNAERRAVLDECIALIEGDLSDCSGAYIADRLRDLSFQPPT